MSEGSSLGGSLQGGMRPILEGSKGELNRSALPQRTVLSGNTGSTTGVEMDVGAHGCEAVDASGSGFTNANAFKESFE